MANILLVIKGGFGDVFPPLAMAEQLVARGHRIIAAGESHHTAACNSLAIPFVPLDVQSRRSAWVQTLVPGGLKAEIELLLSHARAADLVIGNQLAYAGAIACEVTGKPWVYCAASPLSIPSQDDPPLWPYLRALQRSSSGRRAVSQLTRWATRVLMAGQSWERFMRGHPSGRHPRFEGMYSKHLNLLMTSPQLVRPQRDWPPSTVVTGFAWFEPRFIGDGGQFEELRAFAERGEPPVVFAPGGGLRADPEQFISSVLAASQKLGCRAIVVAGKAFHRSTQDRPDILFSGYFPFGQLFPLASGVVHSAGIGTVGWSLRHGVPSLLLPREWDQFDNADRVARAGLARAVDRPSLTSDGLAEALQSALQDTALGVRLARVRPLIAQENGAEVAANAVEGLLARL